MLSAYPLKNRVSVRFLLTGAWFFAGCAGLSAAALVNITFVRELGIFMTILCGAALAGGALIAALGVAMNSYRWEWGASWLAAFGLSPYLIGIWLAVWFIDIGRISQALLVTSLVVFFLYRSAMCAAHAAKLRSLHQAAEVTFHADDDDDDSDDSRD
jgi:hypothetical protein